MTEKIKINIDTVINAPLEKIWNCWTIPHHITRWNFASDDWHTPRTENDLKPGGIFKWRMEAKDGSMGFDFSGKYTTVIPFRQITNILDDGRIVQILFSESENGIKVTETFEAEETNPTEKQREGWQAILNNFKKYVEAL